VENINRKWGKIRINSLITFRTLVRLSSFSEAAKTLGMTQSAVSQQIAELEDILGHSLVDRSSKKFHLTEAGHLILKSIPPILDQMEQIVAQLHALKGEERHLIQIASSSIPGEAILPGLCNRFQLTHPHADFQISISNSDQAMQALLTGKVRLCAIGGIFMENSPQLDTISIGKDEIHIIARKDHPIIEQLKQIPPPDKTRIEKIIELLFSYTWVFREEGSATRKWFLNQFPLGNRLRIGLELHNNLAIVNTIENSDALSIISSNLEPQLLPGRNLELIDHPLLPRIRRDFFLVRLTDQQLPPMEQLFWDEIQSENRKNKK
jgi:DNA-binding transcriptional LysR family regulator